MPLAERGIAQDGHERIGQPDPVIDQQSGPAVVDRVHVAGDPGGAEFFLHEMQEIDWQRYGQSGRSRADLKQMRLKIEREQGSLHPFKSGRGGYYDIDFILMYLRLKSAGVFFKVLNTPARIEVLENMGHLNRAEAQFLDDAATFFRALDHGLRVLAGRKIIEKIRTAGNERRFQIAGERHGFQEARLHHVSRSFITALVGTLQSYHLQ